jgi:tetratricopeptide (TPR) repeat protein
MIYQTPRMVFGQRLFSSCLLILLTLFFAGISRAQMGGIDPDPGSRGTGGRNTIEGRVYYPSGRNVDKRLKLRLSGLRGGDFFTLTDDSGAFSFRRIAGGTYVVSLEGENEYEPVNEQVDIFDTSSSRGTLFGRTYNLQIQLRFKGSAREKSGVINAALMAAPKPAAELYQKALQSEKDGDINKALDELQRAVALYPQFTLALNEMGILYQRLGKFDEAAKALGAAVKVAPQIFELRLNYGIVLLKNKQFADAEPQLHHATEIRSASTLAHLYRGKALIQLHHYPQAESELQEVIKLGGEDVPMAYRFLGALYNERGENKLAITALEKYLSLAPTAKDADSVREIIKQLRTQN